MRFRFVEENRGAFEVGAMCGALEVSRSGYYAWCERPKSERAEESERLGAMVERIHEESRSTYGVPRVHAELQAHGETCGRNRVARLMRERGLRGKTKRRFRTTTKADVRHAVASNLVERDFCAAGPDQVWVGDTTYLRTQEGWLYLAVLLDLYSRMVVGWSMGPVNNVALTLAALAMALGRRRPLPGLIHHTDRGSPYTAEAYQRRLRERGLRASMSDKGDCYDNAAAESFFHSLKTELADEMPFRMRSEARAKVFDYIEVFYNRRRLHSSLGYLSPAGYEAMEVRG
jgi:transposase InsO family protein